MRAEPAGLVMDALRAVLDPWLGTPRWKQTEGRVTFTYRFGSEDAPPLPMKLKVEINSREHFAVHGFVRAPFTVTSRWYEGTADIPTYNLNELLGTKLRALYQRRKSRDLYDLAVALDHPKADPAAIVAAFAAYMDHGGHSVTRALFEKNLALKLGNRQFKADIASLLAVGHDWDIEAAAAKVGASLIALLSGPRWNGKSWRGVSGASCRVALGTLNYCLWGTICEASTSCLLWWFANNHRAKQR